MFWLSPKRLLCLYSCRMLMSVRIKDLQLAYIAYFLSHPQVYLQVLRFGVLCLACI